MPKLFKIFLFSLFLLPNVVIGQADDNNQVDYYLGFEFAEGVYVTLDEFKNNQPSIQTQLEKRDADLYIWDDSIQEMVIVDPEKVWGFSKGNNIYIAYKEGFWRVINLGTLCHFSAIIVSSFQTVDAFGFPVTQYSKTLQHLFLNTKDGEIYGLEEEYIKPFMEEEPILDYAFERKKKKREADLIQALKSYNENYLITFPIND